ncbi:MAG: hypothetical protein SGCHY_004689 [Lobulomycetales sp.]
MNTTARTVSCSLEFLNVSPQVVNKDSRQPPMALEMSRARVPELKLLTWRQPSPVGDCLVPRKLSFQPYALSTALDLADTTDESESSLCLSVEEYPSACTIALATWHVHGGEEGQGEKMEMNHDEAPMTASNHEDSEWENLSSTDDDCQWDVLEDESDL